MYTNNERVEMLIEWAWEFRVLGIAAGWLCLVAFIAWFITRGLPKNPQK